MQYISFGNSGMKVSRLSVGAMGFGNSPEMDEKACAQVLDEALDHGINLVDTADSYKNSEEMLGKVLTPEKREKVFLATKVFRRPKGEKELGRNSRENISRSLENGLRLMNTDYVDLFQLHHPDPQTPIDETMSALDELVKQGKVRHVGVSNHYAWQMAYMLGVSRVNDFASIVSLQANYNILGRQIEMETVPFCQKFNIALMCYGPLDGGILTGKYLDSVPEKSRATWNRRTRQTTEEEIVHDIVTRLAKVSEEINIPMNQIALLWLLSKEYATTILLGGSRPEHYSQIYGAIEKTLPEEIVEMIDNVSLPRIYQEFGNQPHKFAPELGKEF